ncbi:FAD-dependent monooxygenase [Planctobacterium marinum]|uniref:FAD-dependent monooxygenase n=1 Tax=Planctobacterium marinum TaxID=1631968 RepID=UPI001E43EEAA|nr:FAD-dependent monooxygenase [Planctobacterium marinum]MCC2604460.1 FAD-dependent monooxygenase [Planctobacterium marinum]
MGEKQFDLIVFGGGMVGASAALGFVRRGLKVAIVEPDKPVWSALKEEPEIRVSAFSLGSEQLLTELGAWSHLRAGRLQPYRKLSVWETPGCETHFSAADLGFSHLGYLLENRHLQLAIHQALSSFESQISWFSSGRILDAAAGQCQLDSAVCTGTLVVGADGGNSAVRRDLQVGETGWQYQQQVFALNIKTRSPSLQHTFQQFSTDGPMAYLPLFDHYAALVWYLPADKVQVLAQTDKPQLKNRILQEFPALHSDFEILNVGSFPIRRNHANHYFKGRVVLCGDAAHSINPLAGQGVNLGFQDVAALLEINLNADISAQLQQYETTRRRENSVMMTAMDGFNIAFCNPNPILKLMRNTGLFLAQRSGPLKKHALKRALGVK